MSSERNFLMAVKIRLSRFGKKNAPQYRIVVTDERNKRDGKFIENVGTYNPLNNTLVQFHEDRINDWVSKGAIVTDSVRKLQKKYKQEHKA
jgi:small subunit ribosomal protein S16